MHIEHIAIWTSNLGKMKDFYVKYFNGVANSLYHNPKKEFSSYFISFESGARLELMHRPQINVKNGLKQNEHLGITHLAISLGTKIKVDELTHLLNKDGYIVVDGPRTTGDGYYESVVLDPENNMHELTV